MFRTGPKIDLKNIKMYNIYLDIDRKKDIVAKMWVAINPHLHRIGHSRKGEDLDAELLEGVDTT